MTACLLAQAAEKGLAPEPMRSYLDCFRCGCPPHGGFGLGLGAGSSGGVRSPSRRRARKELHNK